MVFWPKAHRVYFLGFESATTLLTSYVAGGSTDLLGLATLRELASATIHMLRDDIYRMYDLHVTPFRSHAGFCGAAGCARSTHHGHYGRYRALPRPGGGRRAFGFRSNARSDWVAAIDGATGGADGADDRPHGRRRIQQTMPMLCATATESYRLRGPETGDEIFLCERRGGAHQCMPLRWYLEQMSDVC